MIEFPVRLLLHGYGLALGAAAASLALGAPLWAAAALAWLGGAVATLGLGVLRASRAAAATVQREAEDAALAAGLARWERDRRGDAAAGDSASAARKA